MTVAKIALSLSLGAAFLFVSVTVAAAPAQQPDVRISELDCSSDPELVGLENQGDASQELIGWRLESDPSDSETFDLSVIGGLQPGVIIFVESGPSATAVFTWSTDLVFRDDDPTDYVRLVDDQGETVDELSCTGTAPVTTPTSTATPTAAPEPEPTPTPEPSSPDNIPNGGGVPPPSGIVLPNIAMVIAGASMATAGLFTASLSLLRRVTNRSSRHASTGAISHAARRPLSVDSSGLLLSATLLMLTALVGLLLLRRD